MDLFHRIVKHQLNIDVINKHSIKRYYRYQFKDIWEHEEQKKTAFELLTKNAEIHRALASLQQMQTCFEETNRMPDTQLLSQKEITFFYDIDILRGEQLLEDWHFLKLNPAVRPLLESL